MKNKSIYWFILIIMIALMQHCTTIELPYFSQARYADNAEFESGACSFPGVTIHRRNVPEYYISGTDTFLVAGFQSIWYPGQPPFACDRLSIYKTVSIFHFNIRSLITAGYNSDRLSKACLELHFDRAVAPRFEVTYARPWGFNGGLLESHPNLPNDYSRFTVKAVTEQWSPDNMNDEIQIRRERIPSSQNIQSLASNPAFILSPNNSIISINVTDEINTMFIQEALNSENEIITGFAIMHAGEDHIFQHTNFAMAAFKPILKLSFRN